MQTKINTKFWKGVGKKKKAVNKREIFFLISCSSRAICSYSSFLGLNNFLTVQDCYFLSILLWEVHIGLILEDKRKSKTVLSSLRRLVVPHTVSEMMEKLIQPLSASVASSLKWAFNNYWATMKIKCKT